MNKLGRAIFVLIFLSVGCFDIFKSKQTQLVGKISLIDANVPEQQGYSLIYNEGGHNSNIVEDYIQDVTGNDTMLLVKAINENCDDIYYKVTHNKGDKPIQFVIISANDYRDLSNSINGLYTFSEEVITTYCK